MKNQLLQLHVPRIEDLPYFSSPPVQFNYQSTAPLALGSYTWNDQPSPLTPLRPLLANAYYFFRTVTIMADVDEGDYMENLSVTPLFYTFTLADSKAVLFREPIFCGQFFKGFDFRKVWTSSRGENQLLAAFRGTVVQGPGLVGKTSITLKAVISAQEITDENYTQQLRHASSVNTEVDR